MHAAKPAMFRNGSQTWTSQAYHVAAVIARVLEVGQAAAEARVQALVLIELHILPAAGMTPSLIGADPSKLQHTSAGLLLHA